jgi:hypothetical protein
MKANIGKQTLTPSRVLSTQHPPITGSMSVKEDNGVIADGQIVAKDADGEVVPHAIVENVAMAGTIDGANKAFTATIGPCLRGSIAIANNNASAQALADDGNGNLVGAGSGTVNYKTGAISAAFTTAPAAGKTVLLGYRTQPVGVNLQECDTSEDDTALVVRHGAVNRDLLLTGAVAADAVDVAALEAIGTFAV